MNSKFLVRSEHLNHQGHLFGGDLMAEIDTLGFCLVRETYSDKSFVTRAAEIEFQHPAFIGDIITFTAKIVHEGNTSVQVQVTGDIKGTEISQAKIIYVNLGPDGKKAPIHP